MKRSIVRLDELDNAKGGDLIDFLSKPTSYAGGHRVITKKGPIFQKDSDFSKPAPQLDISINSVREKKTINLPDLVTSPVKNQADKSSRNGMGTRRNNSVTLNPSQ